MGSRSPAKRVQPTAKEPIVIQLISDGFEARDISATGAGIFVPVHLEGCSLRSPVKLVVQLPESEPFRARGRIVHRTKLGREFLGVEFMNLSQAQVETIENYVERRLSQTRPSRAKEVATRPDSFMPGVAVAPQRPRVARSSR